MKGDFNKQKSSFAKGFNFYKAIWIFVIGCFIGCIWEMGLHYVKTGCIVSRSGLIYGLLTPVYGAGAILYMYTVGHFQKTLKIFSYSMIIGGSCEWLCSYLQELIFGTISWNYSSYFFNIGGRTSLFHATMWGLVGVLFVKILLPVFSYLIEQIPNQIGKVLTWGLLVFLIFDIFISFSASYRQTQRLNQIPAENKFQTFLDKTYPDERMNKIYSNKKIIQK